MENDIDRLDNIGKVAMRYYAMEEFNPTWQDFELWIESLKEPMRSDFRKKGLEGSKGILNFRRFYLEIRDQGMEEYMKANLSQEDYLFWKEK